MEGKQDWRKQEKEIYGTGAKPQIITLPKEKYFLIHGKGDPNTAEFSEKVSALMSLCRDRFGRSGRRIVCSNIAHWSF